MATAQSVTLPGTNGVPRLENGDHLTRAEFERRFDADPTLKKAELIDGVVYMPSPVRQGHHSRPHFQLISWLGRYAALTPGVDGGDNATLRLDLTNDLQPDAFLMIAKECGGQAAIDQDDYVAGAPEWVGEVASSSVSYDLHVKQRCYQSKGVKEYVVWRVADGAIDWFVLRDGSYVALATDTVFKSTVFPGLWLDAAALLAGQMQRVFEVLDDGLAQPEHAAFVRQLEQRRQD
jgi:Uma2 family endonuclease